MAGGSGWPPPTPPTVNGRSAPVVRCAAAVDRHHLAGPLIVVYGDSYLDVDVDLAVRRFHDLALPALMVVYRNRDAFDTSNAAFDGRLVRYEKGVPDPRSAGLDMIDYGLSILDADIIRRLVPADEPSDLSTLQAALSRDGRLGGFEVFERFYEIGSPAGLEELDRLLRERSG